ncbi:MAG: hypothetical protein ACKVWV_04825 [Planctomycetota bacterium]
MKHPFVALFISCCVMGPAAADVLVVNGAGGTPWQSIQAAVDAASDGDTILVKRGSYAAFTIDDKALRVVAESNHTVEIFGTVVVHDLAAQKLVVLAGLEMTGLPSSAGTAPQALFLLDDAGSVRVQDCRVRAADGVANACAAGPGARVHDSTDVAFVGCSLFGLRAHPTRGGKGGSGLLADASSSVACYDVLAQGGDADACSGCVVLGLCPDVPLHDDWCPPGGFYPDGSFGGDGFEGAGFLFASNARFQGGDGGNAQQQSSGETVYAGIGGDGVRACTTACTIWLLDEVTTGGAAGGVDPSPFQPWRAGAPGVGVRATDGATVASLSGMSRTLVGPNVVREAQPIELQFFGEPGDTVHLFIGSAAGFQFSPALRGVKLVRNAKRLRIGQIGASGVLAHTLSVSELGAGVLSKTLVFQSLHGSTNGRATLGTALAVVVVDSAM